MTRAEQLTDAVAEHGEGPVWWPVWGGLRWVDMLAGDVLTLDGSGNIRRVHVGKVAAALRPRTAGGMVIATEHDFVICGDRGEEPRVIATPVQDNQTRFNEGGCDPEGHFFCGTMRYDQGTGGGTLYRLRSDHSVDVVLPEVTVSNGLIWTGDGATAYYVDSATHRIDVFDHNPDDGLHNRRTFVEIPAGSGDPDGLTIDVEGGIWVALWKGGAVRRYAANGSLDAIIDLPTRLVTACTFGGPDLDELYITTSRYGEQTPDPSAGAVFVARPGVAGLPVRPYAG
jgi:sugar lactone lactonase YvrE